MSNWPGAETSKNSLDLSLENIDYSVHCPFGALHSAVRDIFGSVCGALRDVSCRAHGSRLDAANGDSDRENDQKKRFHST